MLLRSFATVSALVLSAGLALAQPAQSTTHSNPNAAAGGGASSPTEDMLPNTPNTKMPKATGGAKAGVNSSTSTSATVPAAGGAAVSTGTRANTDAKTNTETKTHATQKINLNTATAEQLDALPKIGAARSKAIVEARAKGKFKNWDDFVARGVVPSDAEASIKDQVSF